MAVDGTWKITVNTPMGPQDSTLTFSTAGNTLTGSQAAPNGQSADIIDGEVNGNDVSWKAEITRPMPMTLKFSGTVEGDNMSGSVKLGMFGSAGFTGNRV